jgi:hypothetical protein
MRSICSPLLALALIPLAPLPLHAEVVVTEVAADPASIKLVGPSSGYTLLLTGKTADGRLVDLTHQAKYQSSNPQIASVSETGYVRGRADGNVEVAVEVAGKNLKVPVQVAESHRSRIYHFENDILPILSRFACNSSGCHGKAEGQNGFKLSVFGFDPPADFNALVKESRGRRVFVSAPEQSLLLTKVCGTVAHGGGLRIPRTSADYDTLRGWVGAGVPQGSPDAPKVTAVRVEPHERVLAMHSGQQLRVVARYSDGREVDVTPHAKFQSNNESLASVNPLGLVMAGEVPGEGAIMASYMNAVDVFRAVVPRTETIAKYPDFPTQNFIDPLVSAKLRKLNVLPSELCDDSDYLRRVYLDVIGTLPTAEEARRFLTDKRPDRRAKLVDGLLARPEFADYWALKWADLLRVDRQALGHKRAYSYYQWIRASFAENKPLDKFTRELLVAEGPLGEVAPASFYKVVTKPGDSASTLAQVFLGVRIACAQCHHHPFDRWGQDDYYGMQAYFAPLSLRGKPGSEMMAAAGDPATTHPRTGARITAHALGTAMPPADPKGDRRVVLADWMTAPANPWFARNMANRTWAHFLGRGIVEPVDDVRATNPPTNPELLDALAKHLVDSKYDFRQLVRAITASRVYQLSSKPNATNEKDEQNYSRALLKRVDAEVLLDMVCQASGVPEKFEGVPAGTRAVQLWDSKVRHYFLKVFGRPQRVSACECERVTEPGVAQVLHFLNSPEIHAKLAHERGTVARLLLREKDDGRVVDELYLTAFSRLPTDDEKKNGVDYLKKDPAKRRQAAEDLAWSLLNSLEFVFNH